MEVYFELISEPDALKAACLKLEKEDYLGFDTETTELDPFEGMRALISGARGGNRTRTQLTWTRSLV